MKRLPVVVYGPQGCGKTTNAAYLARAFVAAQVLDNWLPGDPLPPDALALSQTHGDDPNAIPYVAAMEFAKWADPAVLQYDPVIPEANR